MPDLCIPASHYLNLHIDTIPRTSSTLPAMHFGRPGNTEHVRSVSASRGQNSPPLPDLCIPASHYLNLHIDTNPRTSSTLPATHFGRPGNTEHVHSVSASRDQKSPPLPDLCIPASHYLNLHIDTIPWTSSTPPTTHFRRPGNTEHVRSVSVSWGHKSPFPPDLCIPASHYLNPHIDTIPQTSSTPLTTYFGRPGSVHSVSTSRGQNSHLPSISPPQPAITSTAMSTPSTTLPPYLPPSLSELK
jgi:hypothetical protein